MFIDASILLLVCLILLMDRTVDANMLQLFVLSLPWIQRIDAIFLQLFVWSFRWRKQYFLAHYVAVILSEPFDGKTNAY